MGRFKGKKPLIKESESHADSTIIYDLTGKGYTSFSSYYGVDLDKDKSFSGKYYI